MSRDRNQPCLVQNTTIAHFAAFGSPGGWNCGGANRPRAYTSTPAISAGVTYWSIGTETSRWTVTRPRRSAFASVTAAISRA